MCECNYELVAYIKGKQSRNSGGQSRRDLSMRKG